MVTHMDRVVAVVLQSFGDDGGKRVIDEKSHGIARGSSRSRTASAAECKAS